MWSGRTMERYGITVYDVVLIGKTTTPVRNTDEKIYQGVTDTLAMSNNTAYNELNYPKNIQSIYR